MDDPIDGFPFFEYPLIENHHHYHQTEANTNVLRFDDPVPGRHHGRFSRFTIGQPPEEKTQVNEGMVVTEPVNANFYNDILLGTYNNHHDLDPNSAEHFMDLSDLGVFLPQNLQSNPSGQEIMDLDHVGGFPPQSNPSGYLMDTTNAGGYPLQNHLQSDNLMNSAATVGEFPPQMFQGYSNSVSLPVWPVEPIPFSCSCCHVLREIIHVNGTNVTKLEIHGTLGMIAHAILENRYAIDCNGNFRSEYQMFDFGKKSIENVREFLVQYCEDRRLSGYELVHDPLLGFYEALCVGTFQDDFLDIADFFPPPPTPPPPPSSGFNAGGGGGPSSSAANGFGTGSHGIANGNGGASTTSGANGFGGGAIANATGNGGASTTTSGANGFGGGAIANANANGGASTTTSGAIVVNHGASTSGTNANGNGFQFFQQQPPPLDKQKQQSPAKKQQSKPRKTPLALQRERTGKLVLGDLRGYFNLPMEVAARRINVCPTVMKKICRRGGLDRWPYRKVNSLERKIIAKTIVLNMKVGEAERVRVQAEIDLLQSQINEVIADLLKES